MNAPDTISPAENPSQAEVLARDRSLHRHVKTRGEKRFNWQTYTGLGYFANVGVSLAAVFAVERTRLGQKLLGNFGKVFEKFGMSAHGAHDLARRTFFLTGGFVVIPFMKWMEDHKVERVKQYNREIYGEADATDPVIRQSEQDLETAPKQSWKSIITGRMLALVPFYLTIGLLWGRTSLLSRITNAELGAMSGAERKAAHVANNPEFAAMASRGFYIDKPISILARDIGKLLASGGSYFAEAQPHANGLVRFYHGALNVIGKALAWVPKNPEATRQIEEMERLYPGTMKSVKEGKCDPIHSAFPNYVISEAITSAMVAWGLYLITRVTGPFFGKKQEAPPHPAPASAVAHVAPAAAANPHEATRPSTRIAGPVHAREAIEMQEKQAALAG